VMDIAEAHDLANYLDGQVRQGIAALTTISQKRYAYPRKAPYRKALEPTPAVLARPDRHPFPSIRMPERIAPKWRSGRPLEKQASVTEDTDVHRCERKAVCTTARACWVYCSGGRFRSQFRIARRVKPRSSPMSLCSFHPGGSCPKSRS